MIKNERNDSERERAETASASEEVAANTLLCLINQAIYLLKRQLEALEKDFLNEGEFTERLYRKRRAYRR